MTKQRFWIATTLAVCAIVAPADAQQVPLWVDAAAPEPLAPLARHLGTTPTALKAAFPSRKGFALTPDCKAVLLSRDKQNAVFTVDLVIKGPGCFDTGMAMLKRAYGEPAVDGYGYGTAIGNRLNSISVMMLKWCPSGYDVWVVQRAGYQEAINISVASPGAWNPKTGRRVAADSPEQRASCTVGKAGG